MKVAFYLKLSYGIWAKIIVGRVVSSVPPLKIFLTL